MEMKNKVRFTPSFIFLKEKRRTEMNSNILDNIEFLKNAEEKA